MKKLIRNNKIKRTGPLVLAILDGIGIGPKNKGNAVHMAHMPVLDKLLSENQSCLLQAHGRAVGLPSDKDMGNSEVGHNALGAGRIYSQGAKLVNEAFNTGDVFKSETWKKLTLNPSEKGTALHFLGLLSDGNVHSHINHLLMLLEGAHDSGVNKVRIHILLDGRDVPEKSSKEYVTVLEKRLDHYRAHGRDYAIASGGGRMTTTMDRYEADWDIVKRGWEAHILGTARQFRSATDALKTFYRENPAITDQYLPSFTIVNDAGPIGTVQDGDSFLLFNFRGDRAIEISRVFDEPDFSKFDRERVPDVFYAGMMQYDGDLKIPKHFLVHPPCISGTISEYLVKSGIHQYAVSETQKFGHVTYFWNGNRSGKFNENLETYMEIPSDRIEFNKKPKMKASEITEEVIKAIHSGRYEFIRFNFANGDMVGHTGDIQAGITAAETVDTCLGEILDTVKELGGIAVITADHGNLDEMFETSGENKELAIDKTTGEPIKKTSHTLNPVPFIIYDPEYSEEYEMNKSIKNPGLANVAATLLMLMGFEKPEEYSPSLINLRNKAT